MLRAIYQRGIVPAATVKRLQCGQEVAAGRTHQCTNTCPNCLQQFQTNTELASHITATASCNACKICLPPSQTLNEHHWNSPMHPRCYSCVLAFKDADEWSLHKAVCPVLQQDGMTQTAKSQDLSRVVSSAPSQRISSIPFVGGLPAASTPISVSESSGYKENTNPDKSISDTAKECTENDVAAKLPDVPPVYDNVATEQNRAVSSRTEHETRVLTTPQSISLQARERQRDCARCSRADCHAILAL
ncbi:hypothetical protein C8Q76DRAFT_135018 [Earliella scabrosa]|nr:hypothetical protein C8Q76DRAFT_135018 [Earliella scabrosa]